MLTEPCYIIQIWSLHKTGVCEVLFAIFVAFFSPETPVLSRIRIRAVQKPLFWAEAGFGKFRNPCFAQNLDSGSSETPVLCRSQVRVLQKPEKSAASGKMRPRRAGQQKLGHSASQESAGARHIYIVVLGRKPRHFIPQASLFPCGFFLRTRPFPVSPLSQMHRMACSASRKQPS